MNQAYDGKMSELDSSSDEWRETMNKSYSAYEKDMNTQSDFIIDEPMENSALTSMTEKNTGESDDDNGHTAVRSGISSINVIAMYQNDDGSFSPIYYDGENHHVFITDDMAFNDEMILYKSRVSLPFECSIHGDEIMRQLDKINESIPEWDATKILSNEFALIFNDDGYAEIRINGETRRLKYDCTNGLNMIGLKS